MKKYEVLKRFRDINTREKYEAGSVYETADKERGVELQEKGFLKATKSVLDGNVTSIKTAITADLSPEELNSLLEEEKAGEDRKGVKEHIEALLKGKEDEPGKTE